MRSTNKSWTIAGTLLVAAMLSLSVCINACSDLTPASSSCPHHQENSDCCKHPNGDSATLVWNPQKQHPHIAFANSAVLEFPIASTPVSEIVRPRLLPLAKYHDPSGPPGSRILSLRI